MWRQSLIWLILFATLAPCWGAEPLIFAHRGGKADWPENTMYAFRRAVAAGVDGLELDVQVNKDGVVVVYHPQDLSVHTNGTGTVADHSLTHLRSLNAAWNAHDPKGEFAAHQDDLRIPLLAEVLHAFPELPIIVDLKSPDAKRMAMGLAKAIASRDWKRLVFYSTSDAHLKALRALKPQAITFESRKTTRDRILGLHIEQLCEPASKALWVGFEMRRRMHIVEKLTLGPSASMAEFEMWTPESVACTRKQLQDSQAKILFFGINDELAYRRARQLGADAVLTDSPRTLIKLRSPEAPAP